MAVKAAGVNQLDWKFREERVRGFSLPFNSSWSRLSGVDAGAVRELAFKVCARDVVDDSNLGIGARWRENTTSPVRNLQRSMWIKMVGLGTRVQNWSLLR